MTCKHKPDVTPVVTPPVVDTGSHITTCSPDTVYFTNTILPLIASSCAMPGCHDGITRAEGVDLTSYSGIMRIVKAGNPGGSRLYNSINGSRDIMPPAGSPAQAQINLIYKWVQQGAKNNFCDANTGPCDSSNISYKNNLVPLFNTYCRGCHNSGNVSGGVNLDNYNGVAAVARDGQLMGGILGKLSPMPKYGLPLSNCNIGKIRQWIKAGANNN